jgi:hypothetical protein
MMDVQYVMAEHQGLVDHFNFYIDFFHQRIANSLGLLTSFL